MGKEKKAKIPFWENWMWWCLILGAVFAVGSIIPVIPWRYARVDTNMGNRFVMERYYSLFGASNNLGKTESWLSLRMKMKRKVEEFGRPSPMIAIMGTVTQSMGTGGAAMGCTMWMVCKEHVNARFMAYSTVGYGGIALLVLMILGALLAIACTVYLGFEQANYGKKQKKKKKDDDECLSPMGKTMLFAILGYHFVFISTTGFVCLLGKTLQDFKRTSYYPFAASHAGPFAGWFASFLLFQAMCIAINRSYKCCGKKEAAQGEDGMEAPGYGPPGAHGPPPDAYGPPPGAYGPPPGGKGGKW
jgi:hypothetical protein